MKLGSANRLYVATILFDDKKRSTREFLIFRSSIEDLQEAVDQFKMRLIRAGCTFAASIIETVEENFDKEYVMVRHDDVTFH